MSFKSNPRSRCSSLVSPATHGTTQRSGLTSDLTAGPSGTFDPNCSVLSKASRLRQAKGGQQWGLGRRQSQARKQSISYRRVLDLDHGLRQRDLAPRSFSQWLSPMHPIRMGQNLSPILAHSPHSQLIPEAAARHSHEMATWHRRFWKAATSCDNRSAACFCRLLRGWVLLELCRHGLCCMRGAACKAMAGAA